MIQKRVAVTGVLLLCLLWLPACGAGARTKGLRVSLLALNTARDSTLAISAEREKQLYDTCLAEAKREPPACTKEEGHARVGAWQKKIDAVIKAIDTGYRAVHDAALLDNSKSAIQAAAAAKKALDLYHQLKDKP